MIIIIDHQHNVDLSIEQRIISKLYIYVHAPYILHFDLKCTQMNLNGLIIIEQIVCDSLNNIQDKS
jgi:hypothetical protein